MTNDDLRAENERLKALLERAYAENERLRGIIDRSDRDFAGLRAENERLKAELEDAAVQDRITRSIFNSVRRELGVATNDGVSIIDHAQRIGAQLREAQATIERLSSSAANWQRSSGEYEARWQACQDSISGAIGAIYGAANPSTRKGRAGQWLSDDALDRILSDLKSALASTKPERLLVTIQGDLDATREAFTAFQEQIRAYAKECEKLGSVRRPNASHDVWSIVHRKLEGMLEGLCRAAAKPEPTLIDLNGPINEAEASARPGWVAASVLRAKAEEWSSKSFSRPYDEYGDGKERGYSEAADELTTIADNAGGDDAVERAACATVQRMIEDRLMLTSEEQEAVDKYLDDKSHGRDWYNNETYYPEDIDKLLAIIDRLTKPETVLAEAERLFRERQMETGANSCAFLLEGLRLAEEARKGGSDGRG